MPPPPPLLSPLPTTTTNNNNQTPSPPLPQSFSPSHSTASEKVHQNPDLLFKHLPNIERADWDSEKDAAEGGLGREMDDLAVIAHMEVEELDQAGNVVATYIASSGKGAVAVGGQMERELLRDGERIDVVIPKRTNTWAKDIVYAFLPAGYPHSVTSDYMEYQIYDSMQAFSSSIASLLASRAVLEGVGVGDSEATPTAALLLSVLQSSMGRIATILFAHRLGTSLEPECKMYRLAADFFNDSSMILDCLSPIYPKPVRVVMYSLASVLRALCGVAAGSSKASLSAHFAKWGNLGELNAKDSSQETIISLMGMLTGSLVVSHISTQFATWTAMIFLLGIHLATNYMAVRAVSMRTLNRQRANIVISHYLSTPTTPTSPHPPKEKTLKAKEEAFTTLSNRILTPTQVSFHERIFERDGVLRWNCRKKYAYCTIGVSLQSILGEMSTITTQHHSHSHRPTSSPHNSFTRAPIDPRRLIKSIQQRGYFLWYSPATNRFQITLSESSTTRTQLLAWFHALISAREICEEGGLGFLDGGGGGGSREEAVRGRFLLRRYLCGRGLLGWARRGRGGGGGVFRDGSSVGGGGDGIGGGLGIDEEFGVHEIWAFLDAMADVAREKFEGLWSGLAERGWDSETGALETKSGTRVKAGGAVVKGRSWE